MCSIRSDGNIIPRIGTDILGHKKRPPTTAVGAQKEHSNDTYNIAQIRRTVKWQNQKQIGKYLQKYRAS